MVLVQQNHIAKQIRTTYKRFSKKVLPIAYRERGILPSEGLAFCAMLDMYEIDILIESGMAFGFSTEIWAKYFSGPIYTFDTAAYGKRNYLATKIRLLRYRNVTTKLGKSSDGISTIADENKGKRVALFIDGPKDKKALQLAREKMERHRNIIFVGIHDVDRDSHYGIREELEGWGGAVFFTDSPWFRCA